MKKQEPILSNLTFSRKDLESNRKFGQVTKSGVVYDCELAGPGGMSYVLMPEKHTTQEMIVAAVLDLRSMHDVVGSIKIVAPIDAEQEGQIPAFRPYEVLTDAEKSAFDARQGIRPSDRERIDGALGGDSQLLTQPESNYPTERHC